MNAASAHACTHTHTQPIPPARGPVIIVLIWSPPPPPFSPGMACCTQLCSAALLHCCNAVRCRHAGVENWPAVVV